MSPFILLSALLVGAPLASPADTTLVVMEIARDTARLGENVLRATVRNRRDTTVTAVLDLRAVPGMWMIPNMQRQFAVRVPPGEERDVEGVYEFTRMSIEATLRVRVGTGEQVAENAYRVVDVDYERTWPVGEESPDAYDPVVDFDTMRRGPLELYAWRGSRAAADLETIAAVRLSAVEAIEGILGVEAPERIRMVFYADEQTKIDQTGHRGIGWATGSTLVEVHNDSIRLDPYHELAHIVASGAGSPPPALGEGFAVYAAEHLGADALLHLGAPGRSTHAVVCEARDDGRLIPLEELMALDNIGSDESRAGLEYAEAGSFVRFLVESLGTARFRRAYAALSDDAAVDDNLGRLEDVTGLGAARLESDWLRAAGCGDAQPWTPPVVSAAGSCPITSTPVCSSTRSR